MYDGTITYPDPSVIDSWDLPGGFKAYVRIDESPEAPTTWGRPGRIAITGYGTRYDLRGAEGSEVPEGLADARERWGGNTEFITRYLRIFHDAAAVDTTESTHTRADWIAYGVVTRDECAEHGIEDPEEWIKGELELYRQWAEGEVYGVTVVHPETGQEAALWGCYDDSAGYKYLHQVAEELAAELSTEEN